MSATPSISVIIPCFNQEQYLPRALDSVLQQTHQVSEIVVVDDGSPDNTAAITEEYIAKNTTPIRLIQKSNAGLSAARNSGILASQSDLLVFLDSDDMLPSNALERHVRKAQESPEFDVFFTDYHFINEQDQRIAGTVITGLFPSEHPLHGLLRGSFYPPHAAMVRKSAIANAGLFDVSLRSYEDWDFWLRLASAGCQFTKTDGIDVPYRQYPGSMSKNLFRMYQTGLQVLAKKELLHQHCADCIKLANNTRWGLRRNYLAQWREAKRRETSPSPRLTTLLKAVSSDPLLLAADLRQWAQSLSHLIRAKTAARPSVHS